MQRRLKNVRLLGLVLALAGAAFVAFPATANAASPTASVSPSTGLKNGSKVTITYSGFPANAAVSAVQCATPHPAAVTDCDITNIGTGTSDGSGAGTVAFTVHTGTIGAGTCDGTHNTCIIAFGDNAKVAGKLISIRFAASPTKSTSPSTPSPAPSSAATAGGSAPTAVPAGSGGHAPGTTSSKTEVWPVVALTLGALFLLGSAAGLRRRRSIGR